jgi:hypothetical protein
MRHIGIVRVSPELIADHLTPGSTRRPCSIVEGLPAGAVLVNACIGRYGDVEFHYSHESFPEVQEGAYPEYEIKVVCHIA